MRILQSVAMIACAVCAHPIPAGARFCPNCGAAVANRLAEERRVVTVLFADLVGSTSLAEELDPERVKRLIDSCFQRLVADIEAFGGQVDKLMGDAIIALFGAPVAHEDDAERAVRAALRMHETLGLFAAGRSEAASLQMRIGINTGEVLVGTLAGIDYTAMGDVVNMASRLQSLAPPDGVLVGAATAALLSPAIARAPFGETVIRGRQRAEQPWLITGATTAGTRPIRADLPFVGRRSERAVLDSVVNLVRSGRVGVVSVVGEAGSGKTRLVEELIGSLRDDPIVLSMTAAPYGERNPWGPLAGGMAALFGLPPDPDADDVRRAVEARAQELWRLEPGDHEVERYGSAVLHVLGMPSELDRMDPAGAADRLAGICADMIRRHAQTRLTVLWFDNLQWAQPTVRRLLAVVVRSLLDLPFLVVTAQRPDDAEQWPPAELDRPLVVRLPLGPLNAQDARALVRHVLAVDQAEPCAPDSNVDALAERGGGNPLFLVELAAVCSDGQSEVALSGSLRALIAARLDQLPANQRAIVDNAAVLGTSDVVKALEHFASELGQPFREEDVAALAADGIFKVEGGRWRFASEVVREVAYQTLTKRTRASRHAGVAAALRQLRAPHREHLAHHSATAAELVAELGPISGVPDTIRSDAVLDLLASAEMALAEGRALAATRHASRALDLGPGDDGLERRLLVARAAAELELRRFPEAERDARTALERAVAAGDTAGEADARLRLGTAAHHLGDLVTARRELDQAVATLRAAGDQDRLAEALRARGFAEVFGGSLPAAREFLDEAMELFHQSDNERGHAWTHHNLAWVAFQAGDVDDAERQLAEACERFEALDDRVGVNWANGLLAYVTYFQRRFEEAEALATSVEAEARRWGDTWARLMMQTLIANLRLWSGRLDEAESLSTRALAGFREAGDRYGVMQALAPLSRVRAALGKPSEAERGSEELVALGHSFGELGLALQGAAGVAVHLGQAERALVLAEQVLDRQRATGSATHEAMVLRALALAQLGQIDDAAATIETVDVSDFPFCRAARALVRALVGDGPGALADAAAVESARSPTYFDRSLALLATVLAPRDGAAVEHRERAREQLAVLANEVGDATFLGVVDALNGGRAGSPEGNGRPRDGWQRMVTSRLALGGERGRV